MELSKPAADRDANTITRAGVPTESRVTDCILSSSIIIIAAPRQRHAIISQLLLPLMH